MSNRNKRIKPIEANLRKEIEDLEDQVLDLHEENSDLRKLIDEQMDYIKQRNREIQLDINMLKVQSSITGGCLDIHTRRLRYQISRIRELKTSIETQKEKLQEVTGAVVDIATEIEMASETFLGRFIFKWLKREERKDEK